MSQVETREALIRREAEITGQIKIEIRKDERGFYLIVNGLELADYYCSLGISCSGGRLYYETLDLAQVQADAEIRHFLRSRAR